MEEAKVMVMTRRRISYVPGEIKREILLRLPVKSLVRFRSMDKRLRHMISTQQFIIDHLKTFRCEEDELLLLHRERSDQLSWCFFLDGLVPKHIENIRLPYENANYSFVRTVGYCNGIVCLICHKNYKSTWEVLFLNPSIRKVVAIPDSHQVSSPSLRFGFGYVEDDYKLVVLPCRYVIGDPLTAKVFSLKTRNWATVACSWPQPQDPQHEYWEISSQCPVFLDGACYWLAEELDNGWCSKFVLSFYLSGDHTIGKIVLPRNLSSKLALSIHVYKGCLSLIVRNDETSEIVRNDELWVMNKCGAVPCWTRLIERMCLLRSFSERSPTIVGFTSGGDVVYSRKYWLDGKCTCEELLCYNPTTQTNLPLKKIPGYELSSPHRLYAYKQNLVLLDQDVQVHGELR